MKQLLEGTAPIPEVVLVSSSVAGFFSVFVCFLNYLFPLGGKTFKICTSFWASSEALIILVTCLTWRLWSKITDTPCPIGLVPTHPGHSPLPPLLFPLKHNIPICELPPQPNEKNRERKTKSHLRWLLFSSLASIGGMLLQGNRKYLTDLPTSNTTRSTFITKLFGISGQSVPHGNENYISPIQ